MPVVESIDDKYFLNSNYVTNASGHSLKSTGKEHHLLSRTKTACDQVVGCDLRYSYDGSTSTRTLCMHDC